MKRLSIIFFLIYINVPGQQTISPDNIQEINSLNLPSANELLWTTTLSYCNVYFLVHKILISVGVPLDSVVISNDELAAILIPDNPGESGSNSPLEFLRFIEASQYIDDFVFDTIGHINITDPDINTGRKIWDSIEDSMIVFMENILLLTNQVNQMMHDINNELLINRTNMDKMTMIYLYIDIFDQTVDAVWNNSVPYKEAFNFFKTLNLESIMNNVQMIVNQEEDDDNHLKPREFIRMKLIKVYELYVDAFTSFYDCSSDKTHWSQLDFIKWYDLSSSKSIFDYVISKLLSHTTTLTARTHDIYKYNYNSPNILTITSMIQEYVETNLNYIIQFVKTPLQNIITINDEEIINGVTLSSSFNDGDISVDTLLSVNNGNEYKERIKNIENKWIDTNINTVINYILDKYSKSECDTDINHNNKLMFWAELITIDAQNVNVLESSIYALVLIKNVENIVTCTIQESSLTLNTEQTIKNLLTEIDEKLNALYFYNMYSLIYHGKYIIPNLWDNVIKDKNNIFNLLDWLNQNSPTTVIPHWPNDEFCDKMYIKNLVQLASVSSDMLYDVTFTSIYRALKKKKNVDEGAKTDVLYILQDLEESKKVYKELLHRIKKFISINMKYIKTEFEENSDLNQAATQEITKIIKYKLFASTELIIPSFIQGEYFGTVEPQNIKYYTDHFKTLNDVFCMYFYDEVKMISNDITLKKLIETYEEDIDKIFTYLMDMEINYSNSEDKYGQLLINSIRCAKHLFKIVITDLKSRLREKKTLKLDGFDQEIKHRLNIAVAIIMEDFIRCDEYLQKTTTNARFYNTKYLYSQSVIDLTQITTEMDYENMFEITLAVQDGKDDMKSLLTLSSQDSSANLIKPVTTAKFDENEQKNTPKTDIEVNSVLKIGDKSDTTGNHESLSSSTNIKSKITTVGSVKSLGSLNIQSNDQVSKKVDSGVSSLLEKIDQPSNPVQDSANTLVDGKAVTTKQTTSVTSKLQETSVLDQQQKPVQIPQINDPSLANQADPSNPSSSQDSGSIFDLFGKSNTPVPSPTKSIITTDIIKPMLNQDDSTNLDSTGESVITKRRNVVLHKSSGVSSSENIPTMAHII
ncbi:Hypothetical protein CINCED_3A001039 [Cinara cedri]|uniref:Uncharacterized protein n=1 Tax=Cinara cedri TaxID=506608 RepID=A0A5E4LYT3_9HEMI|nr:Hypothetical protein CINCED_3A001039 [Cinara cedri]